jgi:hypothetical protein
VRILTPHGFSPFLSPVGIARRQFCILLFEQTDPKLFPKLLQLVLVLFTLRTFGKLLHFFCNTNYTINSSTHPETPYFRQFVLDQVRTARKFSSRRGRDTTVPLSPLVSCCRGPLPSLRSPASTRTSSSRSTPSRSSNPGP